MQSVEADQVQLEHNAPQATETQQEPLHYAPVNTMSDHDRRFQKVFFSLHLWSVGLMFQCQLVARYPAYLVVFTLATIATHVLLRDLPGSWCLLLSCALHLGSCRPPDKFVFVLVYNIPYHNAQSVLTVCMLCMQKVPPTTVAPTYKLTLPSEFVLTHMPDMMTGDFTMVSADGTQSFAVSIVPR